MDGTWVINLDECKSIGIHWMLLIWMIIMLRTLTDSLWNIFQNKLNNSKVIKISQKDLFKSSKLFYNVQVLLLLDFLILCYKVKLF